jgi:undecaprenyl-diphosphatase
MQVGNLLAAPAAALGAAVTRRFRLAAAFIVAAAAKLQVSKMIKDEWVRHRPAVFLDDVEVRLGGTGGGLGFVSGHAIIAVAIATLLYPYLASRAHRVIVWTCVAIVLAGRVYVGAHLPLDVICGGLVGLAIGSLLNATLGTTGVTRSQRAP